MKENESMFYDVARSLYDFLDSEREYYEHQTDENYLEMKRTKRVYNENLDCVRRLGLMEEFKNSEYYVEVL